MKLAADETFETAEQAVLKAPGREKLDGISARQVGNIVDTITQPSEFKWHRREP